MGHGGGEIHHRLGALLSALGARHLFAGGPGQRADEAPSAPLVGLGHLSLGLVGAVEGGPGGLIVEVGHDQGVIGEDVLHRVVRALGHFHDEAIGQGGGGDLQLHLLQLLRGQVVHVLGPVPQRGLISLRAEAGGVGEGGEVLRPVDHLAAEHVIEAPSAALGVAGVLGHGDGDVVAGQIAAGALTVHLHGEAPRRGPLEPLDDDPITPDAQLGLDAGLEALAGEIVVLLDVAAPRLALRLPAVQVHHRVEVAIG